MGEIEKLAEKFLPYIILGGMWISRVFVGDIASYTEITSTVIEYIVFATVEVFLLARYEFKSYMFC